MAHEKESRLTYQIMELLNSSDFSIKTKRDIIGVVNINLSLEGTKSAAEFIDRCALLTELFIELAARVLKGYGESKRGPETKPEVKPHTVN